MSETVPTILVKGQDGQPLLKNLSDYDEKIHELFVEGEVKEQSSFDKKSITDFLDSKEIKYAKNISNEKLQKLHDDAKASDEAAAKTQLSIVEKDGIFVIVDGEENQVGAEFFATKEEAEEMLKLFTGK